MIEINFWARVKRSHINLISPVNHKKEGACNPAPLSLT
jgi:hypothetical protein